MCERRGVQSIVVVLLRSCLMPLLRGEPFKPIPPPADLKPDEEVFFCHYTKEAFRSYE